MAGKKGHGGKPGRSGAPGVTRPAGPGRMPRSAIIRDGAFLMVKHVFVDGTANIGQGYVEIRRAGTGRLIVIPQEDGSEIRIAL